MGLWGALAGLGSGLIGNAFHHGYGEAEGYQNQANNDISNNEQMAGGEQKQGDLYGSNATADNQAYRAGRDRYVNYLQQDPNTDQNNALNFQRLTGGGGGRQGITDIYAKAHAMLAARNAASGLDTAANSGPSGLMVGSNTNLTLGQAGDYGAAAQRMAEDAATQHTNALGQVADIYRADAGQGLANERALYGDANRTYGNDANYYDQASKNAAARTDAYNSSVDQTAKGLGGFAGTWAAGGFNPVSAVSSGIPGIPTGGSGGGQTDPYGADWGAIANDPTYQMPTQSRNPQAPSNAGLFSLWGGNVVRPNEMSPRDNSLVYNPL